MKIAPSDGSYTSFTGLVTGYRMLTAVRHAVGLGLFEAIGLEGRDEEALLQSGAMKREEGTRFLSLLVNLGLLEKHQGRLYLSQFSRKYLHSASALSQLHVLQFEEILMEKWGALDTILREGQGSLQSPQPQPQYRERLKLFHKAMHEAAVVRSRELWDLFPFLPETGTIVDVGAGDGTYLKEFLKRFPGWSAVACDLADVNGLDPEGGLGAISRYACNVLDAAEISRFVSGYRGQASMLLLSNFMHCYNESENEEILNRLKELLTEEGMILLHDFFTDASPAGALYDAHMMINTYSGRTYSVKKTLQLLNNAGFAHIAVANLPSESTAIVASRKPREYPGFDPMDLLRREALSLGFFEAQAIGVERISIAPWVSAKCRYGCGYYGRRWSCPPNSMDPDAFRELLGCYHRALVVVGQPPLRDFQARMLELEKRAFLAGRKKALVFTGGPCTWCETCDEKGCRYPEKRRPSLESCGCDVFDLAQKCGVTLVPLRKRDDFVQYVGLLLVE